MIRHTPPLIIVFLMMILFFSYACKEESSPDLPEKKKVEKPEAIEIRKAKNIAQSLQYAFQNNGRINDTLLLKLDSIINKVYTDNQYHPFWSKDEIFLPLADSLINFVENCKVYGLFPSDYHNKSIHNFQQLLKSDSVAMKDAVLWSSADLLLTDAFLLVGKHLKQGRLKYDSVTLRTDTLLVDSFYTKLFSDLKSSGNLLQVFQNLEPRHRAYDSLKTGLKFFLDSIQQFKRYTQIIYPNKDSLSLSKQIQKRLFEDDLVLSSTDKIDSASWRTAISNYQKSNGLKVTGKINENTINSLNNTDWEKFKRIAINLDRYKLLPDTMPDKYVWVNIPSYLMKLIESDSVIFSSRVVVGKPATRTPLLTSRITDMITYPQWTIPNSIVVKEVLPGAKKSASYFSRRGYSLINDSGEEIDPYTVDWNRYTKGIPYKVVQGSGDANALGILKFNFNNKYSVYLHDTNQRYLFKNANRSLSHGCVRVQEWHKLAQYLINIDSIRMKPVENANFIGSDSLNAWLRRKEKHYLPVRSRLPVFIRYFSCEGSNGKVKFFEDIYGEDKMLRQKYFADKSIQ